MTLAFPLVSQPATNAASADDPDRVMHAVGRAGLVCCGGGDEDVHCE
jgi:hypothetical protein